MNLEIPRFTASYDEREKCVKIRSGSWLAARVYAADRQHAMALAQMMAATPTMVHVLMELSHGLPWAKIQPLADAMIDAALDQALGAPIDKKKAA